MAARLLVGVRLGQAGLAKVDEMATETSSTRSAVVRVLLGEALRSARVVEAATTRLHSMKDPTG